MGARDAALTWNKNTEPDLAGYRIYYGQQPFVFTQTIDVGLTATPLTPAYTLTPPWPNSGTWFFVVTAYNLGNLESAVSNQVLKAIPLEFLQAARMHL